MKPFFTLEEIVNTQPNMYWDNASETLDYVNNKVQPILEENERLKESVNANRQLSEEFSRLFNLLQEAEARMARLEETLRAMVEASDYNIKTEHECISCDILIPSCDAWCDKCWKKKQNPEEQSTKALKNE